MSIYLDNAATTQPCEPAVTSAFYCMVENYGNPSSLHKKGLLAEKTVTEARRCVASAIAAPPECIYFTSGATESNNLAITGIAQNYGKRKRKILTTTIEHPSVAKVIDFLESYNGYEVVRIAPDRNGQINYEQIIDAVDENTFLVSCMLVNNETGYILPIKRAFMGIKRKYPDCITHCDCVQGFMKIPIKVGEMYADLISISAHKIHGIKGVGALFIKKGIRVAPLVKGGGQEKGIRSGTESVPLIAGLGAAVKALQPGIQEAYERAEEINRYMREELKKLSCVIINSGEEDSSPYILNISVQGFRSETMLHFLEEKEIYVSSGSACSKGAVSGVLKEFGVSDKGLDSALRISISRETSKEEIDELVNAIKEGQESLIHTKIKEKINEGSYTC